MSENPDTKAKNMNLAKKFLRKCKLRADFSENRHENDWNMVILMTIPILAKGLYFFRGNEFMISYDRFWKTLESKEMSTYKLITDYKFSNATFNRMRHNKPISISTIDRLCTVLHCSIEDIMTYVETEEDIRLYIEAYRKENKE